MSHIAIVDSGVGSLSIARDLIELCPVLDIELIIDNKHAPYGTHSEEDITHYVLATLDWALAQGATPNLIVLACNSASITALASARKKFPNIPFVGVVPAIKSAAQISSHFSVLATPVTANSSYLKQLISDFAAHCQIQILPSQALVNLAEQKIQGQKINLHEVQEILDLIHSDSTHTVLSCTHFPLLLDEFQQVLPHMRWLDSNHAVAKRIIDLIPIQGSSKRTALFTGNAYNIANFNV